MKRLLLVVVVLTCAAAPARAGTELTSFRCGGGSGSPEAVRVIEAMENSYIEGTGYGGCWFHTGHHTYDMGARYAIGQVSGSLFTVETNFSPPTEIEPPSGSNRTTADAWLETSVDGVTWQTLRAIPYNFRIGRQEVAFDFDAAGHVARFIRIRQPKSAAQGLSGFLDSSNFDAELLAHPTEPTTRHGFTSLTCAADIMEGFFAEHPCWFGGINRYDSPSVFHTYAIDDASLDRLSGSATFAPWRTDDYHYDGGSPVSLDAHVQTSTDGTNWTDVGTISGPYGAPIPFEFLDLGGMDARFVRIVGEYMKNPTRHPSLKHVRAILVASSIQFLAL